MRNLESANGCTFSISPEFRAFNEAGGSQTITVTTQAGCYWSAVQSVPWITISGTGTGVGSGSLSYSIAVNNQGSARLGSMLIAGRNVLIEQADSANCVPVAVTIPQTVGGTLATSDCRSPSDENAYSDLYTFSAQAGQRIAISQTSSTFDTYLILHGPNNAVIDFNDDVAQGNTSSRIPSGSGYLVLPFTGTYLIEASSYSADITGSYTLQMQADPAGTACSYAVTPSIHSFTAAGGTASSSISTSSGCGWTANILISSLTNDPWLELTGSRSGSGSGTVTYQAAGNTALGYRRGRVEIGGKYTLLVQSGLGGECGVTNLSPSQTVSGNWAAGDCANGSGQFTELYAFQGAVGQAVHIGLTTTATFTSLSLYGPDGWFVAGREGDGTLRLPGASGSIILPATGIYLIEAAASTQGSFSLALTDVPVTPNCEYGISPTSATFTQAGGSGSIAVTATSGCDWAVTSYPSWVTITMGLTGNGSGTVVYAVAGNTGVQRSGTITVAGQNLTVTQSAPAVICPTVSGISPTSGAVGSPVTITGSGLTGVSSVRFGGGTSATYTVISDTQLTAVVPVGAASGALTITKSGCADQTTTAFSVTTDPTDCQTAPSDMLAWLPGEGTANDLLGNHPGTASNGAGYAPGKVGMAFSFDGVDDRVSLGTWAAGKTWSLEAWIKPSITTGERRGILGAYNDCGDWAISLYGGKIGVTIKEPSACTTTYVWNEPIVAGAWYHVVGTNDGTTARIYVNGVLRNSGPVTANYVGTTAGTWIGGEVCCASDYFAGLIDEPTIYGRALNDAEILQLYSAGSNGKCQTMNCQTVSQMVPTSGAVGSLVTITGTNLMGISYVRFGGDKIATVYSNNGTELKVTVPAGATSGPIRISMWSCPDVFTPVFTVTGDGGGGEECLVADYQLQNSLTSSAGTGAALVNLGTGNNFTTVPVDGASRTVLAFPQNSGLAMTPTGTSRAAYSVAMLFALDEVSSYRRILDLKNGAVDNGLYLQDGRPIFYGTGKGGAAVSVPAGKFVQLVLTRDGEKNVRVYVDGVEQFSFVDSGDNALIDGSDTLRFFQDNTGGSYRNEASAGRVARIRVYNCALSAAAVAALGRVPGGSGCSYTLSKASQSFDFAGGTESVQVTTGSGCAWSITNPASWIRIDAGQNGVGSGTTAYTVMANNVASPREASLTIAGQMLRIGQTGAGSPCAGSVNRLRNPGAEEAITVVGQIPGWTLTSSFSTELYGQGGFPSTAEGQRINGGTRLFTGGPSNASSTATQTVSVGDDAAAIDAGRRIATLRAELGSYSAGDSATLKAEFLNASGVTVGELVLGPVAANNDFRLKEGSAIVPAGTRSIRVTMISIRNDGIYNDGYFDNLFLGLCSGEQPTSGGGCISAPGGVAGWWPGDGNTSDLQGLNPGALKDGATFASGRVGQAFSFDGINDAVRTGLDAQPSAISSSTWEAWVYPTRVSHGSQQQIFSIDDGGYDRSVLIEAGTGKWAVYVGGALWSVTSASQNEWQHVAVVFTPTGVEFYLNGTRQSYGSAPSGGATGQRLWLGGSPGYGEYFKGLIDEATIYNRALSGIEIAAIQAAGSSGKCKTAVISCPTVTGMTPQTGAIGGTVTIGGAGLRGIATVRFAGGVAGYIGSVSDSQLTVIVPPGAVSGPITLGKPGCPDTTTAPLTITSCGYAVSPLQLSLPDVGGLATVTVTTPNTCSWTTTGLPAWATLDWGASGTGQGTVTIRVAANTGVDPRVGSLTIAGQTVTISQAGTIFTNCVNAPAGLVAWYTADGTANDQIAGRNGQLRNGATFGTGKVGQAFRLDGIDDYVEIPHQPELDPTAAATMEAWVHLAQLPSQTHHMMIMSKTASGRGLDLAAQTDDHFWFYAANGWSVRSTTTIQAGIWYHVTGTYVGNGEIRIYVNGVLESRQVITGTKLAHSNPLLIGASPLYPDRVFSGLIDEPSLYDRALTASEVESIYRAGWTGKCRTGGCNYSISKTSQSFTVAGGSDSLTLTTPVGCQWTVSPSVSWISATSSSNGSGNATIGYTVAANGGAGTRTGTIRINEAILVITQAGTTVCTYAITPGSGSFGAAGGTGRVEVTTQADCPLTAVPAIFERSAPWLATTSATVTTSPRRAVYDFTVAPNISGVARQATVPLDGQSFTITQNRSSGGCEAPAFGAAQAIPAAGVPFAIETADFNGDGRPDLAVVNLTPGTVSIYLNNGGAGLSGPVNFTVGSSPFGLAVADFNGDGRVDLATANSESGTVSVLLGDGNGGFGAARSLSVGSAPSAIKASDLNGDGRIDLLVANLNSGYASLLPGDGNGGFGSPLSLGTGTGVRALAIGDFNQDGHPDIAFASREKNVVALLIGAGNGSFTPGASYGTGAEPLWLTVTDLNLDGRLDLVTANRLSDSISVLIGRGDGTFWKGSDIPVAGGPRAVVSGDFNMDGPNGVPDLAVTSFTGNSLSILLGDGGGGFAPPVSFGVGAGPTAAAILDFNGDGRNDVVTANLNGTSLSLLGNICAAAVLTPNVEAAPSVLAYGAVAIGQTRELTAMIRNTGSGLLTVAQPVSSNPRFGVVTPGGSFNLTPGSQQAVTVRFTPSTAATERGLLTIASNDPLHPTLRISLVGGSTACTFTTSSSEVSFTANGGTNAISLTTQSDCTWTATSDKDWITITLGGTGRGDGVIRFNVAANTDSLPRTGALTIGGTVVTIRQAGANVCTYALTPETQSFVASGGSGALTISTAAGCDWAATPTASWIRVTSNNGGVGSGTIDYVVEANGSAIARTGTIPIGNRSLTIVQAGRGAGGGCEASSLAAPVTVDGGANPVRLTTSDLNLDGRLDLVVANLNTGTVAVAIGDGLGGFAPPQPLVASKNTIFAMALDLNRDGKPDIVAVDQGANNIATFIGDGTGNFAPAVFHGVGASPVTMAGGDLNHDGTTDLVVTNLNSGNISILDGDGAGGFSTARNIAVGANPVAIAIADLNHDSEPDLIVTLALTGQVAILYGSGGGNFGTPVSYPVGSYPGGLVVADFNDDNRLDLATSNLNSNTVSVLLAGTNGFNLAVHHPVGTKPLGMDRGDFNLDGKTDLIVTSVGDGKVSILYGDGNGGFGSAFHFTAGDGPTAVVVGDFNGDRKSDAITANLNSKNLTLLLNGCTATVQAASLSATPAIVDYGAVGLGSSRELPVTLRNGGGASARITALSTSNPRFKVITPVTPFDLAAGGEQVITTRFTPDGGGFQTAALSIDSNDPNRPRLEIGLKGSGTTGCTFTLNPATRVIGPAAGSGSFSITTQPGCTWQAFSNDPRLTISGISSGTGPGTVNYAVTALTASYGTFPLTISVGNETFYLIQTRGLNPCTITPLTIPQTISGQLATSDCSAQMAGNPSPGYFDQVDLYSITVTAGQQLAILASSSVIDMTIELRRPDGQSFAVDFDGGGGRNARIPMTSGFTTLPQSGTYLLIVTSGYQQTGSYTLSLTAPGGCEYRLSANGQSFSSAGGAGQVALDTPSTCQWTATSSVDWAVFNLNRSGVGSATIDFTILPNTGSAPRQGYLTIGGQSYTITQEAPAACTFTISPTSQTVVAAGGSGIATVTTLAGCSWETTSNNPDWITITSPARETGSGAASFSVAANPNADSRNGTITIAGETMAITQPGARSTTRVVTIGDTIGSPGGVVSIPIELMAQGDENALGFSIGYDPTILSNPQIAKGADAASATLNYNIGQAAQGRVGIGLALGSGQTFGSGKRQLIVVTLTVSAGASATSTPINFGDQPVPRELVDTSVNLLNATYTAGTMTISQGYEADVFPRPNGNSNGTISITDWVQVSRFASGADPIPNGSEFQRADCAPRSSAGDGRIGVADVVQAGRFATGIDAVIRAGGPSSATTGSLVPLLLASRNELEAETTRTVRIVNTALGRHANGQVAVEIDAIGDENALGFSLSFDTAQLTFVTATTGADLNGANLSVNSSEAGQGRIGLVVALPAGQTIPTGTRRIVNLTFSIRGDSNAPATTITFGDQPVAREMVSDNAELLTAIWREGTVELTRIATTTSAASYSLTALTVEGITAVFGADLAAATIVADSVPLPLELGGTTVKVTDRLGASRNAPLFFVSPLQVNFQIPPGTATGLAEITVTSGTGSISHGTIPVDLVAPAIFTANSDGRGVAAAHVFRLHADGSYAIEEMRQYDQGQLKFVPIPIELGPDSDQVFLILYGSGIRFNQQLTNVGVTIGGLNCQVTYAGNQMQYVGLDQINVRVPRALRGRGEVEIVVTVDQKVANVVTATIK